jgi:hypothetical protein
VANNPADARTPLVQGSRDDNDRITPWRFLGRPVRARFAIKNTSYEVLHGLGAIPEGWQVLDADCRLIRTPGKAWTEMVVYLQSDTDNSFADIAFGFRREEVLLVQAS